MTAPPPAYPHDMDPSPEVVDQRIRELADLWDFWMRLEMDRRNGRLSGPGVRTRPEAAPEPRP